jgi:hypothetical protein
LLQALRALMRCVSVNITESRGPDLGEHGLADGIFQIIVLIE